MLQLNLCERWRGVFNSVVANSHWTAGRLAAEGVGPLKVVWNGVPVRARRPPLSSPPVIAFAGRLIPEKGAGILLSAFAKVRQRIPGATLLIAGDGPERSRLARDIERTGLGPSVRLFGHIAREQMESLFAAAWVQVVPSRWEEPFGLVAAEAMMRGTAVAASRTGGLAELIQHDETGVLVPPGDATALADALLDLVENRSRAEELGNNGRQFALRHLTEEVFVDRFEELYRSMTQSIAVAGAL
jgi:glycosyltransferase involved in cell wall biosynthesis